MAAPAGMVATCPNCHTQLGVPPGAFELICSQCNTQFQVGGMAPPVGMVMNVAGGHGGAATDALQGLAFYPQLTVKQRPKGAMLELLCGFESENKYKIYDAHSAHVLTLKEHSSCLQRQCCGTQRSFDARVCTNDDREVVVFERPWRPRKGYPFGCCSPWFFNILRVKAGAHSANPGAELGWVKENFSFCLPTFTIYDSSNNRKYRIIGPLCQCGSVVFKIFKIGDEEHEVGQIKKKWGGLVKEMFTDCDTFSCIFPNDASVEDKALIIGATMLVDMLHFENNQRNNNH